MAIMVGGGVDSSVLTALAVAEARRRGDGVTVIPIALDYASDGDDRRTSARSRRRSASSPFA
ncbi:MAG: hypothetical protein U0235_30730 [Polyangiaceae bacterium]